MADIGDKLRSAREAKGLSIADIEKATKIQSRYLDAIENNEFDKLPGDFYVRAFIRQYAQIVGLDGKELLSEYHQDVPESDPDEYVEDSIDNKSEEVRKTTDNKKNLWKNYLPRIAVGLGVIIVILVVYFLYARLSSGNQANNNDNNIAVSSQSSSKKSSKPAVKKSTVKIVSEGNNVYRVTGLKSNRKLVVKAGSVLTNVSISINGLDQWHGSLEANKKHELVLPGNATKVVITLGNDTGSSVKIAGKRVPYEASGTSRLLTLLLGQAAKSSSASSTSQNANNGTTATRSSYNSTQRSSSRQTQSSRVQSSTAQSSQRQTQNSQSQTQQSNNSQNNR